MNQVSNSDLSIRRTHSLAMIITISFALGAVAAFGVFSVFTRTASSVACVQRMEPVAYRHHAARSVWTSPFPTALEFVEPSLGVAR